MHQYTHCKYNLCYLNATALVLQDLPTGVTGVWSSSTITISGTPTQSGTFTYTITAIGCSDYYKNRYNYG